MIEGIISILNASLETTGRIDKRYCLVELRERSDKDSTIIPYEYTGKGKLNSVDIGNPSLSWWRLTDKPSFEEVTSNYSQNKLQANYPLRLVVMFRRKDSTNDDGFSPSRLAEDISNLLTRTNGDLRTQLQASQVKVSVNSFDSDTPRVWGEEFQVPLKDPKYTTALISVEINVEVTAKRECWENECDYDPDILHLFNFCDTGVQNRLTETQVDCLSDWLCGTPTPATLQLNGSSLTNIASGVTYNLLIQNTAGSSVGTLANPSIIADSQAQVNGVNTESIPATTTHDQQIHDSAGSDVGTAANPSVIADGTIRNNVAGDWTDSIKAEETKTLAQLKYVDTDQVTEISVDYYPNTVQAVATCTPADYGTRILSKLRRQYCKSALCAFSLRYISDEYADASAYVIRVRRSSDNTEQDFTPTQITDGTLTAFTGAGDGLIVKFYDQTFNYFELFQNTAGSQAKIVDTGVLNTDSQGNPVAITTNTTGYEIGANGSKTSRLTLFSPSGGFWMVGTKNNSTTISRAISMAGNPAVGIADTTSNPSDIGTGDPITYVNGSLLANQQRDTLQAAINNVEHALLMVDCDWTDSANWRVQQGALAFQNYPIGSQMSEFVLGKQVWTDASVISEINTDIQTYYAYW